MRSCLAILALLTGFESAAHAGSKLPLRVMYLGNTDTPRARAFETFMVETSF